MLAYARNEINRTRTTLSKTKPSSEQPRESARGSQPSRTPVTRGGAGERSAPRLRRRKQRPQKNSLLRRKPKSPSEQPRESARGSQPSRTPVTRGGVGERSAPRPFRRKPTLSSEQLRESARGSQPSRTPIPRGGAGEQSAPRPFRRKQRPQKNSLLRRKPKSPSEQPRESARGSQPSRLPSPEGGVGERSAPRPRRRKQNPSKE